MANHTYIGPTYEPISSVESFNGVPRFGHLDDISELIKHIDDDELFVEKAISYALGTIFIASFLLASYIVFLIMISFFRCLCRNKYPILAGKSFDNARSVGSLVIRGFLVFLSIAAIISGVLFLVKGTASVQATADDVHSALNVSHLFLYFVGVFFLTLCRIQLLKRTILPYIRNLCLALFMFLRLSLGSPRPG